MSAAGTHILESLSLWGELQSDPTKTVYAELFRCYPELESLFVMDTDGGVRGSMLQQAFECIVDYVGDNGLASSLITTSRILHEGYGVPDGIFDEFFVVIYRTCRLALAQDFTDAMESEWNELLSAFRGLS